MTPCMLYRNSSPQVNMYSDIEWRFLNSAVGYDDASTAVESDSSNTARHVTDSKMDSLTRAHKRHTQKSNAQKRKITYHGICCNYCEQMPTALPHVKGSWRGIYN